MLRISGHKWRKKEEDVKEIHNEMLQKLVLFTKYY
jgi:hypothetical protein